jgi:Phage tail tube protein, TTP
MALIIADGTVAAVASTYATASNITAITNANPAVATLQAGHGAAVGEFLEITSGWPGLSGRVARISALATNDATLEGIDTSNTSLYPAGTGTGSVRRITAWANLAQITAVAVEGGDQNYYDYQFLDQLQSNSLPTNKSPIRLNMTMADDPGLAQVTALKAAEAAGQPRALRLIFRGGSGATPPRTLMNGYVSYGTLPSIQLGQANLRTFTFALVALPVEYNT